MSLFYKMALEGVLFMPGGQCLLRWSLVDAHSHCLYFFTSSVTPGRALVVLFYVSICIPTFISVGLVPRSGSANLKSTYIRFYF